MTTKTYIYLLIKETTYFPQLGVAQLSYTYCPECMEGVTNFSPLPCPQKWLGEKIPEAYIIIEKYISNTGLSYIYPETAYWNKAIKGYYITKAFNISMMPTDIAKIKNLPIIVTIKLNNFLHAPKIEWVVTGNSQHIYPPIEIPTKEKICPSCLIEKITQKPDYKQGHLLIVSANGEQNPPYIMEKDTFIFNHTFHDAEMWYLKTPKGIFGYAKPLEKTITITSSDHDDVIINEPILYYHPYPNRD